MTNPIFCDDHVNLEANNRVHCKVRREALNSSDLNEKTRTAEMSRANYQLKTEKSISHQGETNKQDINIPEIMLKVPSSSSVSSLDEESSCDSSTSSSEYWNRASPMSPTSPRTSIEPDSFLHKFCLLRQDSFFSQIAPYSFMKKKKIICTFKVFFFLFVYVFLISSSTDYFTISDLDIDNNELDSTLKSSAGLDMTGNVRPVKEFSGLGLSLRDETSEIKNDVGYSAYDQLSSTNKNIKNDSYELDEEASNKIHKKRQPTLAHAVNYDVETRHFGPVIDYSLTKETKLRRQKNNHGYKPSNFVLTDDEISRVTKVPQERRIKRDDSSNGFWMVSLCALLFVLIPYLVVAIGKTLDRIYIKGFKFSILKRSRTFIMRRDSKFGPHHSKSIESYDGHSR